MEFVKNTITNADVFYHSSKEGIVGDISPDCNDKHKKRDFGDGFYLGNKEKQTIALVNSCSNPKLYEIRIPLEALNDSNTLQLSKVDWMFFVLYNRGYLGGIKDTEFYKYYQHLADGKQFIVGAIADDVFTTCMKDFIKGIITDNIFMELIDCYSYGTQIVAKTEEACNILNNNIVKERALTVSERQEALNSRKLNRAEQETDYVERRAKLLREEHKNGNGKFIGDIFDEIRKGIIQAPKVNHDNADNIKFESQMDKGDINDEYEFFK